VGRVSPEKGLHILLKAFEEVGQRYPETELQIVGPRYIAPPEIILNISDD
jgi:glycosyltransferase involved in cell wall biosynthesis